MAKCIHFDTDSFGPCALCKEAQAPKPVQKKRKPRAPRAVVKTDPVVEEMLLLEAGVICGVCNGRKDDHGYCLCVRKDMFAKEQAEIWEWQQRQAHGSHAKLAAGAVASASRRATLRCGRDLPDTFHGSPSTLGEATGRITRTRLEFPAAWVPVINGPCDDLPV